MLAVNAASSSAPCTLLFDVSLGSKVWNLEAAQVFFRHIESPANFCWVTFCPCVAASATSGSRYLTEVPEDLQKTFASRSKAKVEKVKSFPGSL